MNNRGFTLVELTVVIAIIGILIAGSVPLMFSNTLARNEMDTAARQLESNLRMLQNAAANAPRTTANPRDPWQTCNIVVTANGYTLTINDTAQPAITFPASVTASQTPTVYFNVNALPCTSGGVVLAADQTITLQSNTAGIAQRIITINPTGRIAIQ